jgi:23S rRNA (guanosine2251-2'-O)-methyltransferase
LVRALAACFKINTMTQNKIYIYGRHAITEALTNAPQAVRHVYFSKEMKDGGLRRLASQSGIPVDVLDPRKATSWVERNAPHQGAVALISLSNILVSYEEWRESPSASAKSVVILNGIQDPHNVGAVIRSAAAFGVGAVFMPNTKQSPVTGAVIKASSGMAFTVPLVSVANLQQTISDLKKSGFRVYGLTGEGKHSLDTEEFDKPAVFIMGNESEGLQKTAQLCDKLLSIPIEPKAESLNVAAAAAVTFYQWHTKRR